MSGDAGSGGARARVLVAGGGAAERALLGDASIDVVEVASWDAIFDALDAHRPHLVLLALELSPEHEAEVVRAIVARHLHLPVVVVAEEAQERRIVACLKAGASGYLIRADLQAKLLSAVLEAMTGGAPMSPAAAQIVLSRARRESTQLAAVPEATPPAPPVFSARKREILEMLARGLSYDQIALALDISVNTVRSHVREIYTALGASTKVEAVMLAIERGIIDGT